MKEGGCRKKQMAPLRDLSVMAKSAKSIFESAQLSAAVDCFDKSQLKNRFDN